MKKRYFLFTCFLISSLSLIAQYDNKNEFPHLWSSDPNYAFQYKQQIKYDVNSDGFLQSNSLDFSDIFSDTEVLIPMEIKGKWGFVGFDGKIKIAPTYDNAMPFFEGLAAVCKNDKWGYINENNDIVIPYTYRGISPFIKANIGTEYYMVALVCIAPGQYILINEKGEKVTNQIFEDCQCFKSNEAAVKLNGKWGFIDIKGDWIIPPQYDDASDNGVYNAVKVGNKWGYIDSENNWLLQPQLEGELYNNTLYYFIENDEKYILSLKKKGKYYFKRENGFVFGPFEDRYEFDTFYYDSENPVAAVKKDGYWGYIDAQGNTIIPFEYNSINNPQAAYDSSIICVNKNGKYGYIDTEGNTIVAFIFDRADAICPATGIAKVGINNKYDYIYIEKTTDGYIKKIFDTYNNAYDYYLERELELYLSF